MSLPSREILLGLLLLLGSLLTVIIALILKKHRELGRLRSGKAEEKQVPASEKPKEPPVEPSAPKPPGTEGTKPEEAPAPEKAPISETGPTDAMSIKASIMAAKGAPGRKPVMIPEEPKKPLPEVEKPPAEPPFPEPPAPEAPPTEAPDTKEPAAQPEAKPEEPAPEPAEEKEEPKPPEHEEVKPPAPAEPEEPPAEKDSDIMHGVEAGEEVALKPFPVKPSAPKPEAKPPAPAKPVPEEAPVAKPPPTKVEFVSLGKREEPVKEAKPEQTVPESPAQPPVPSEVHKPEAEEVPPKPPAQAPAPPEAPKPKGEAPSARTSASEIAESPQTFSGKIITVEGNIRLSSRGKDDLWYVLFDESGSAVVRSKEEIPYERCRLVVIVNQTRLGQTYLDVQKHERL